MECPHAPACPGCPGVGQPYALQLEQKRALIVDALAAYPTLASLPVAAVEGAASTERYRVRAKLVAAPNGLGLFERGTHAVVDIPECRVIRPRVAQVAQTIRALGPAEFTLAGVDLRECDTGVLVTLIVDAPAPGPALARFAAELCRRSELVLGVACSVRAPDSPQLLGRDHVIVSGPACAAHRLSEALPWHLAAHGAFVQAHPEQAARLYGVIATELARTLQGLDGRRVLELYAGSGSLALTLAARGAQVTAVEAFAPAAERIAAAARAQGLRVDARAGSAEELTARLAADGPRFDAVIVNPPRRGVAAQVRRGIAELGASAIIYVSCEPRTLARDLDHLARSGYRAVSVVGWDMMPHSRIVETLALLVAAAAPAPLVLYRDDELLALVKPPHCTPRWLLEQARALPGAAAALALKDPDAGASGVGLFALRRSALAGLERAPRQCEYLALLRGICRPKGAINRTARTRYARRELVGGHSLVRIRASQPRPGQVFEHAAAIGHPVLGDAGHGDPRSNKHFEFRHGLDRPFLHLARLTLSLGSREIALEAPLPGDLAGVLASLRGPSSAADLD